MGLYPYFLRNTYWLKDWIKGSRIRSQFNDIKIVMENSIAGSERKKRHLENLLAHATQYAPFYSAYKYPDIQAFPVVNKFILQENYSAIQIPYDCIPHQKGQIFIQTTSGSTGTPFSIPQDTRKRERRIAELKYFGEKSGFKSHEKLIQLRTWNQKQGKSKRQSMRENIIPFDISKMDEKRLADLCDLIIQEKAFALRGYASSLDLLAHFVVDNNIKLPGLKIMIAGSEALLDSTRELVENYIGCNIISQYANEENGILAQERTSKRQHSPFYLNHASYFFEILRLNENKPANYGELGRIVLTDLFNYAFPLIRYDTGDTGIMQEKNKYSNGFPVITKLYGRRVDLVFNTKGEVVHPTAISRRLKHFSEIKQWQFIQNNQNEYLLKLILKDHNIRKDKIMTELLGMFGGDANINIAIVDKIPVLASNKHKSVCNNWQV